jgi:hypothetical protein
VRNSSNVSKAQICTISAAVALRNLIEKDYPENPSNDAPP